MILPESLCTVVSSREEVSDTVPWPAWYVWHSSRRYREGGTSSALAGGGCGWMIFRCHLAECSFYWRRQITISSVSTLRLNVRYSKTVEAADTFGVRVESFYLVGLVQLCTVQCCVALHSLRVAVRVAVCGRQLKDRALSQLNWLLVITWFYQIGWRSRSWVWT